MPIISKLEMYGIVLLLIALGMGAAYFKGKHEGMAEVQAKFDLFTAQVKAEGEKARADALQKEKANEKQIADANTGRDRALASLRVAQAAASAASGRLSDYTRAAAGSDKVCFNATAYNAASAEFNKRLAGGLQGIPAIAAQGDAAAIDAKSLIQAWPK